jgi:hypothetical protein
VESTRSLSFRIGAAGAAGPERRQASVSVRLYLSPSALCPAARLGSRKPGEEVTACAICDLHEETGLRGSPWPVVSSGACWAVFVLEVPWRTVVLVDGTERDRLEWVSYTEACFVARSEISWP